MIKCVCLCVCVCVTDSGQIEKQLEDVTSARRDLDDSSKHTRNLEKQIRSLTQEKEDLHKVPPHPATAFIIKGINDASSFTFLLDWIGRNA